MKVLFQNKSIHGCPGEARLPRGDVHFGFLPRYPDQIFEQMDLEESYFIDIITFNIPKNSLEV